MSYKIVEEKKNKKNSKISSILFVFTFSLMFVYTHTQILKWKIKAETEKKSSKGTAFQQTYISAP